MLFPLVKLLRGICHRLFEPGIELSLSEQVNPHAIELQGQRTGIELSVQAERTAASRLEIDAHASHRFMVNPVIALSLAV